MAQYKSHVLAYGVDVHSDKSVLSEEGGALVFHVGRSYDTLLEYVIYVIQIQIELRCQGKSFGYGHVEGVNNRIDYQFHHLTGTDIADADDLFGENSQDIFNFVDVFLDAASHHQ